MKKKSNTLSTTFEIILTESYISDSISDVELNAKILSLMGKFETLFSDIVKLKAGSPGLVINIEGFNIDSALLVTDDKVIVVQGSFSIYSRTPF